MGSNQFAENLVEVMLSWVRLVVDWFWSLLRSGAPSGISSWFGEHWKGVVLTLMIAGLVIDWLVWMIRWRPYWLWFRKKQIIYEDEEKPRHERPEHSRELQEASHFHGSRSAAASDKDFEDPFAQPVQKTRREQDRFVDWDAGNDPYAPKAVPERQKYADWDSNEDPYASQDSESFRRPSA